MLIRSLEGPAFQLLQGDDLAGVGGLLAQMEISEAEATLPLAYLLGLKQPQDLLPGLEQDKQRLVVELEEAGDYEPEQARQLITKLRDTAIACKLLYLLLDYSQKKEVPVSGGQLG